MDKVWQVCSRFVKEDTEIQFTEWHSNISVYNPYSGNTHLLNLFPFEIVRFLLEKPASFSDIATHTAVLCDEKQTEQWANKVLSVLKQLKALELVDYQNSLFG